jgi:hypothetical protein
LPVDLQLDVCQRCHIQGNAVLNNGKSFYDFKPGMHLSDVMNVFMPLYKGNEEEHIMASHAERLKQSPCFINTYNGGKTTSTSNALTCITCHDPHVSRLETPKEKFNNVCKNCHNTSHKSCSEKQQVLIKESFNCVKCHMPENGTTDIPHVSVHDHKIGKHVTFVEKNRIKEFVGIAAINNPNPPAIAKANAFINYFEKFGYGIAMLDSALKYIPMRSDADIRNNIRIIVHIYFLKRAYPSLLDYLHTSGLTAADFNVNSLDNEDAWTCYRIGEAYKLTGLAGKAESYYAQCYHLTPFEPRFANEYGEILANNKKYEDAVLIFKKVIEMNPKFAPAYSNLGYILMITTNNIDAADSLYRQALKLNPDYEAALLNRAAVMMLTGNKPAAIKILSRILILNPDNYKAKTALAQLRSET